MPSEVRVGVVGTSWWADLMHLPSIKSHPQAQLSAICGRNRERATEMAAKYEIPLVFTNYHEMLADAPLDAVVIATPDDLHYPITMAALDAGLHVMCEKPLANDASQARALYEKAEAAGLKHGVFFTWPWLPYFQRLQGLVDSGYVGRPYHGSLSHLGGYARDRGYMWRFDAGRANGILADLGSHAIQFARLYLGEITRVSAALADCVERSAEEGRSLRPANDAAALVVEFESGALGTIQISGVAYSADRGGEQHCVIHGEAGTLESAWNFESAQLRGARATDEGFTELAAESQAGLFDHFCAEPVGDRLFIDAILQDQPFTPSFYDGWRVQQVIDAALQSHREGRWVTIAA